MKEIYEIDESFEDGLLVEDNQEEVQPDDWGTRNIEEEFEGLGSPTEEEENNSKSTDLITVVTEDYGNVNLSRAEEAYEMQEFENRVQPILTETTKTAVGEAVKYQQNVLKLELQEVLQGEVGYRLSKYEKRRKRRAFKDGILTVIKLAIVIGVIGFVLANTQLRTRISIVAEDFVELVQGLLNNEEVSSNQLVHDLFKDLGDDLDEVNTVDTEEKDGE